MNYSLPVFFTMQTLFLSNLSSSRFFVFSLYNAIVQIFPKEKYTT